MVGASPSFSDEHVVRTLLALERGKVGRKRLVRLLGLGEGSVRTILKKLGDQSLIRSSRQGHELTPEGKLRVGDYLEGFTSPQEFHPGDLSEGFKSLLIVHNASDKIKTGMKQRDIALASGADGALILVFRDNNLEFPAPGVRLSEFPETGQELGRMKLGEGDVVVISFGKTQVKAEDGAVAIALELTK
ncbi:MAG: DUF4443 domain-containing protein [Candidatus Altiarchaeota archaeon]|nr:DUF4443 domain-containing protein [Candidatus Altiarchaeota archaeon]